MRTNLPLYPLFYIILHRKLGKYGEGAFFRHKFCIRCKASLTKHHVNDAVQNVLCLFYFLVLPFYNPFIYCLLFYSNPAILQGKL